MIIVGIDLSLTSTGLAKTVRYHSDPTTMTTALAMSKGKNKDTLAQRFDRQTKLTNQILEYVLGSREYSPTWSAELVVIEGLFASGQLGGSQIDRFGLWWRVVGSVLLYRIPVLVVTASQGKKFLTGAGNADKGTMVRYASKLWPDWEPSTANSTEDEADAIALASIGLALTGEPPFEMTVARKEVIKKLEPQAKEIGL